MESTRPTIREILHRPISRRSLQSGVIGVLLGAPAALWVREVLRDPDPGDGTRSYSQAGEDLAAEFFFQYVGISHRTYLDIGAFDPISGSNSYFFYRRGNRGVLVEPNAVMCQKLREVRPGDTVLNAGIGVTASREADYYVMSEPAWNTFSPEEAAHQEQVTGKRIYIKKVVKVPLRNINDVMQEHFGAAPAFLSIDAEGWHLPILQSMDFDRFRPPIICVETLISGTRKTIPGTPRFMTSRGYVPRGGSFVNTLFVDSKYV